MSQEYNIEGVEEFFKIKKDILAKNEYDYVMNVLEKIKQSNKNSGQNNNRQLSEEYKLKGNAAYKEEDLQEALKFYSLAIETDPTNYLVYSNRSLVYQKINEIEKSIDDCLKGIELEPKFIKFYIRLAMIYSETDKDKAYEYCIKGLEYEPDNINLNSLKKDLRPEEGEGSIPDNNLGGLDFDMSKLGGMLQDERFKGMVQSFIKDKSPEELNQMMSDVMKNFKK